MYLFLFFALLFDIFSFIVTQNNGEVEMRRESAAGDAA